MQVRTIAVSGVLLGAASLGLAAAATPALAVCETYSGVCASPPPGGGGGGTDLGGTDQNPGSGTDAEPGGSTGNPGGSSSNPGGGTVGNPATLPFTGGELVLLTAIGAGALAGGTALVVAGRRKTSPAT